VSRDSFYVGADHIKLEGKRIRVPKLGWVRMSQELRFPGKPMSATFSRQADRWFVSIQVQVDDAWEYPHRCKSQASVGVDLGVHDLVTLSTGETLRGPKALTVQLRKLRKASKEHSRRKLGSKRREKSKMKLARLHARISDIRRDFTHKATADLVERFACIGVEDLDIAGMLKNRYMARHIGDMGWYELRRQLEYKAELAGGEVVVIDRDYPSSQMCSSCGEIFDELKLGTRKWRCSACGAQHDRDVNAAINIQMESAWRHREDGNARGEDVSRLLPQTSVKREGGGYGC
jgi:putative transposase